MAYPWARTSSPIAQGVLGKRLMGFGPSLDREEFQLVFDDEAVIALASGKLAVDGGADEGLEVRVRP